MERYIEKEGKQLRYGYTTGTCATGAALAAAQLLFEGHAPDTVRVRTPKGWELELEVLEPRSGDGWAQAAVRKDAGDDPDVTDGALIVARVERNGEGCVLFRAGDGVGTVTRPGLRVPPGEAAVNPVPRQMICQALEPYTVGGQGLTVTLSVPGGDEIAQKTFNPRLGIQGGISIIGTSGVVEPMSEEALKESLALELDMQRALGKKRLVFSPGNYGRDLGEQLGLKVEDVVKTSNYVGFMLDRALQGGVEEILWVGHLGKLVKVAAGIFQTHSSMADGRLETLGAWAGAFGAAPDTIRDILACNTTEAAVAIIKEKQLEAVFGQLAETVSRRSMERVHGGITVGTVLFTLDEGVVGMDRTAERLLEALKHENS